MTDNVPLLQGVRIVDVTKATSGPFGTQILADLGAEVIKVEEPPGPRGRDSLQPHHQIDGMDAFFLCVNRNKRSVALKLADPDGLELFYRLVENADVVVDNFRPGVTQKLRIDHDTLAARNPRIITASLSGFGATGPLRHRAAFDITVQAQTGMTHFNGLRDEQGRLKAVDAAIADLLGGMYTAIAVPAALARRASTGVGAHIDVGMYDSVLTWFAGFAVHLMNFGEESHIGDNVLWGSFDTKDRPLVITAHRASQFARFCHAVGHPEWLEDPRFADPRARTDNIGIIKQMLDVILPERTAAEWMERFEAEGVSYSETLTMEQALGNEHTAAREMVVEATSSSGAMMKLLGNPIKVDGVEQRYTTPPRAGEHTAAVLGAVLGTTPEELLALVDKGVVYDEGIARDATRSGAAG